MADIGKVYLGLRNLKEVSFNFLSDILRNLYNIKVKLQTKKKKFHSSNELPDRIQVPIDDLRDQFQQSVSIVYSPEEPQFERLMGLFDIVMDTTDVVKVLDVILKTSEECFKQVQQWNADDTLYVGVVPHGNEGYITYKVDKVKNRLILKWNVLELASDNLLNAVTNLLQKLRNDRRQPTPAEYMAIQEAYRKLGRGVLIDTTAHARPMGTAGFRPFTQTYMSLTDPGDGHVLGTTRFNEWMQGAIIHVEHLERPSNLPRQKIESYRIPTLLDFAKVRLHVGSQAPTTYFVGRHMKDSGDFENDFIKMVRVTAGAATAAFYLGAAECKISMEGLSTSQALHYMRALSAQVLNNDKQILSAAWNLNQTVTDDYGSFSSEPTILQSRMDIAMKAIQVTSQGGFQKVTWDGASDTYPSKCIMYQLTPAEALTIVHEAHIRGLITYFSAGFKFDEIQHAVYAGVDGIGIGGAQVLRYMDHETGMHGPYMEENIPKILERRDEAASTLRGRGAKVLARLDTMFFEGSINLTQQKLQEQLFKALLEINEKEIEELLGKLEDINNMPDEGNAPLIGRARRLVGAWDPLLKSFALSSAAWTSFTNYLNILIEEENEEGLLEEYMNITWLKLRRKYRKTQLFFKDTESRTTSFMIPHKSFQ